MMVLGHIGRRIDSKFHRRLGGERVNPGKRIDEKKTNSQ